MRDADIMFRLQEILPETECGRRTKLSRWGEPHFISSADITLRPSRKQNAEMRGWEEAGRIPRDSSARLDLASEESRGFGAVADTKPFESGSQMLLYR